MNLTQAEASVILDRLPTDPHASQHLDTLIDAMGWSCHIPDCPKESRALGMCDTHYREHRSDADGTCQHCGAGLVKRRTESATAFAGRKFCNRQCFHAHTNAARGTTRRAEVIEDVEWLLRSDNPANIPARVGYTHLRSLRAALVEWGRADLAARLHVDEVAA